MNTKAGLWKYLMCMGLLSGAALAVNFSEWSAPVNLGTTINTASNEQTPSLSKTGLSLYFASNRTGTLGGLDIWVAQRPSLDAPWGAPQNLGSTVNSPSNDFCPHLSSDGYTLIFSSNRTGGIGANDLYVVHRSNQRDEFGWNVPLNLGSGVNSTSNEQTPGSFEDDNGDFILYFASDRPGGPGSFDIYASVMLNDGTFGTPVLVPELSGTAADSFPTPRRNGVVLYLASGRTGTLGADDLWVSTRPSTFSPWSTPKHMGPVINTVSNDTGPAVPFSGTSLVFQSNRSGGQGGQDLYLITRTALPGPVISLNGVVNAFTYTAGPMASGSIVAIFGSNLATGAATGQLVAGDFSTNLSGTRVSFNFAGGRIDAPLLYISPSQINARVPAGVPAGSATLTVSVDDATSAAQPVTIQ